MDEERCAFKNTLLDTLEGTLVSVAAGGVTHDTIVKPLVRDGVQAILDCLHSHGFTVIRLD